MTDCGSIWTRLESDVFLYANDNRFLARPDNGIVENKLC